MAWAAGPSFHFSLVGNKILSLSLKNRPAGTLRQPIRLMKMVTSFGQGGTEGQVNKLVHGLDHDRFELRIACLNRWGCHLESIEARGIPVREFPIGSLCRPHALKQLLALSAYMRRTKTQILHSYNFYSNVMAVPAARLAGVPVVIASVRDQGVYMSPAQKSLHRWICGLADKVMVNADSIRGWLIEEGVDDGKILTVRNGIDTARFSQSVAGPGIRGEYAIPSGAPLVLMLSRLNPQKGVDDFLEAAARVSRRHPDARFMLVGERLKGERSDNHRRRIITDEDYHNGLRRLSDRLGLTGRLIFAGRRSDVPEILAQATVSVLPSHSEGIPNALLESMAAGVPVVATRVGGIPELVEDGKHGFLVPVKDTAGLADRIYRLLADPALARRCGQSGYERVRCEFSLERMIGDTEGLYLAQLRMKTGLTPRHAAIPLIAGN